MLTLLAGLIILIAIQVGRHSYKSKFEYLGGNSIEIIGSKQSSKIYTIICHGYAGSKEMMRQIAFDIANAGSNAVLFDFIGHGSNSGQLVNNPTELSGTTQQLVDQLISVIDFLETEYGSDIKLYLIGHSMASDIVIRASEYKNITSIAAISPYSTKVTKNFPNDLLLISGQFEKHLRSHSLKFTQLVDPNAAENIEYLQGPNRRKASYTKNTGHVSVIYAPKTSKEIIDWFKLNYYARPFWATHIMWILLSLTLITFGVSRLSISTQNYQERDNISKERSVLISFSSLIIACLSSFVQFEPFSIFGFGSIATYFGLIGVVILCLSGKIRKILSKFYFIPFLKLVLTFLILAILINHYVGSFVLTHQRLYAFITLLVPITIFCMATEKLVSMSTRSVAVFTRIAPIIGFSILLTLYPGQYGVMFTTVPIYIFYFIVFGFIGKYQRNSIGPCSVGAAHGVFLAFAFSATNPIFSS
jgi:pimeloyl-ACP methyl ester carboxylesterase